MCMYICYMHTIYISICMHTTLYICKWMLTYDICTYIHMFFTHIDTQTHIYMYAMVSSNQNTTSVISRIKLKFIFSFVSRSVYQRTINSQICSMW